MWDMSGNVIDARIVAGIGAVVKQKFTSERPYAIDSCHYFEVISLFPTVCECRMGSLPF